MRHDGNRRLTYLAVALLGGVACLVGAFFWLDLQPRGRGSDALPAAAAADGAATAASLSDPRPAQSRASTKAEESASGALVGRLIGSDQHPEAQRAVRLQIYKDHYRELAAEVLVFTTDSEGRFRFERLPTPAHYGVLSVEEPDCGIVYIGEVQILPEPQDLGEIRTSCGHPIRGHVTDPKGVGVEHALVRATLLLAEHRTFESSSALTLKNGEFEFAHLPDGATRFSAEIEGGASSTDRPVYVIPTSAAATEVRIVLDRQTTLRGVVVDDATDVGVAATIELCSHSSGSTFKVQSTADGAFACPIGPVGETLIISATADGYSGVQGGNTYLVSQTSGISSGLRIRLARLPDQHVRVVDATGGTPICGAELIVGDSERSLPRGYRLNPLTYGSWPCLARADKDGTLVFPQPRATELIVRANGYAPTMIRGTMDSPNPDSPRVVKLDSGASIRILLLDIPPYFDSQPIATLCVRGAGSGRSYGDDVPVSPLPVQSAEVRAGGATFNCIPPGEYVVRVGARGTWVWSTPITIASSGFQTIEIQFKETGAIDGVIQGYVRGTAGALVIAECSDGQCVVSSIRNEGEFGFPCLPIGDYTLHIEYVSLNCQVTGPALGCHAVSASVHVGKGATAKCALRWQSEVVKAGARAQVLVNSEPGDGLLVKMRAQGATQWIDITETDAKGEFIIPQTACTKIEVGWWDKSLVTSPVEIGRRVFDPSASTQATAPSWRLSAGGLCLKSQLGDGDRAVGWCIVDLEAIGDRSPTTPHENARVQMGGNGAANLRRVPPGRYLVKAHGPDGVECDPFEILVEESSVCESVLRCH
jgi:hypothetical protein